MIDICTMAGEKPVELYDPKKYLDTYYYTIRMPHEQPQLLEILLAKYQEFFAKGRSEQPLPLDCACIYTVLAWSLDEANTVHVSAN